MLRPMNPTPAPTTILRPWDAADIAAWRARQTRRRRHDHEVVAPLEALHLAQPERFDLERYGTLDHAPDRHPLLALRSRPWRDDLPCALITGGVHGYETSGVHGALRFARDHAARYDGRVNLLIVPCVSPWGYEHIQRWNPHAVDPNRSFRPNSPAPEAAALMRLVAAHAERWRLHIDLHETTDSDETEFRPALAARDGQPFVPGRIPDGFYLVGDEANPQLAFQQAVLAAVARVTHLALSDGQGCLLGTPTAAPGVILYPLRALGLCAGMTDAPYTTTTEVYPDSPRTTPAQCNEAQATAICAALDFVLAAVPEEAGAGHDGLAGDGLSCMDNPS